MTPLTCPLLSESSSRDRSGGFRSKNATAWSIPSGARHTADTSVVPGSGAQPNVGGTCISTGGDTAGRVPAGSLTWVSSPCAKR